MAPPEAGRLQTYSQPAAPAPASAPARAGAPGREVRVAVARAGTGMLVSVRIDGSVTAPFLVDTGATDVLIPAWLAKRLGIQPGPESRSKTYRTANGVVTQSTVMLRSVDLGGAVVENVPASISPSMEIGLLGLSFFNHFTYHIDAAAGVLTLVPNDLAESGAILGGRSEAQWRAEYQDLRARIEAVDQEYARKSTSKAREREHLEKQRAPCWATSLLRRRGRPRPRSHALAGLAGTGLPKKAAGSPCGCRLPSRRPISIRPVSAVDSAGSARSCRWPGAGTDLAKPAAEGGSDGESRCGIASAAQKTPECGRGATRRRSARISRPAAWPASSQPMVPAWRRS
jgi:aspartyl protease family protein